MQEGFGHSRYLEGESRGILPNSERSVFMYGRIRIFLVSVLVLAMLVSTSGLTMAAELWHYWLSGGEREALDALMKKASALYPGTTFKERGIPGASSELRRQLGAAFMANDPPEIYQSAIGYDLKSFVDSGRLAPIDDVWKAVNGEEVFPAGLKNMVKFDGHVYAIPLNMHVINHIFYNKHIFDKYDLKPPRTWEEFKEICNFLRSKGIEPLAGAAGWAIFPFYTSLISVLGPEGYVALGNGEIPFTDPKIKEAFRLFKDTIVAAFMEGWSGYGWAEAANPFMQDKVAMYLMGDWLVALLKQRGWEPGVDFDFFPAPGTQDVVIVQVDAFAAPKGSADPEGAKKFLIASAGVEGQSAFNRFKGSVAANLNVSPRIYGPVLAKTYERVQMVSREGTVLPNLMFLMPPKLYQEFWPQVDRYALNPNEETLNAVVKELETIRQELAKDGKFVKWPKM